MVQRRGESERYPHVVQSYKSHGSTEAKGGLLEFSQGPGLAVRQVFPLQSVTMCLKPLVYFVTSRSSSAFERELLGPVSEWK